VFYSFFLSFFFYFLFSIPNSHDIDLSPILPVKFWISLLSRFRSTNILFSTWGYGAGPVAAIKMNKNIAVLSDPILDLEAPMLGSYRGIPMVLEWHLGLPQYIPPIWRSYWFHTPFFLIDVPPVYWLSNFGKDKKVRTSFSLFSFFQRN